MASLIPKTFGDMINIVERRAKIAGTVQTRDRDLIKDALNEANQTITTERAWKWRKFDRTFNVGPAITTGTVSATLLSRELTFTGLTISAVHLGRSIRIDSTPELYRIIGIDTASNKVFLDAKYVGATNALATYRMFQYEYSLPPDLDTLQFVYIDSGIGNSGSESGQLEDLNNVEFNRLLSVNSSLTGSPSHYTQDGDIFAEDLPPLDEMVLDYDFLGGEQYTRIAKIRIFPIESDQNRIVHLNYSRRAVELIEDIDEPLMPIDDRWVLIHYALGTWHSSNSSGAQADRSFKQGTLKLAEMRQEYIKTDVKPKLIYDGRTYQREHNLNDYKLLHRISRVGESS